MANALVRADALSHLFNIYPQLLTQAGDFIDKGYARGEKGIGRVLGHLGGATTHAQNPVMIAHKGLVERAHYPLGVGIIGPQYHSIRSHEIINRGAFFEELGVTDHPMLPGDLGGLPTLQHQHDDDDDADDDD